MYKSTFPFRNFTKKSLKLCEENTVAKEGQIEEGKRKRADEKWAEERGVEEWVGEWEWEPL